MVASRADDPGERCDELSLVAFFVRAGERMDEVEDLDELWRVVAAEAAGLLGASAKVMQWTGRRWVALVEHPLVDSDHGESAIARPGLVVGHARSVLVTDLQCSELRSPVRLVWTSPVRDAFGAAADLAAEYTRFTSNAVRRACGGSTCSELSPLASSRRNAS